MKLTWLGHSCFLVETAEGSAVFDPYAPGSVPGLCMPEVTADTAICSHDHDDHNWSAGVKLTGRVPGFTTRQLHTWHDEAQGCLRGPNTITVLEAEGLRVAHLGDLGHKLSEEQVQAIGPVDVLLIPVGGYFTIGPETAWKTAKAINARIVVPMHYRGAGFGYEVIGPVEDFLALVENVQRLDTNVLEPEKLEGPVVAVLRCPAE